MRRRSTVVGDTRPCSKYICSCEGSSVYCTCDAGLGRWIIDSDSPNVTAKFDLDGDSTSASGIELS